MSKKNTPFYKKAWFWVIIVICLAGIGGASVMKKDNSENQLTHNSSNSSSEKKDSNYAPGEEFSFDNLTLKISPEYSFSTIDNMFSDDNGKTVVVIPVTVTNNDSKAKTLNLYSYKGYGAQGVELSKPSAYFMDESVDFGGDLQPGSSYTKNMYFLYDGNGTYKIEFGYYKTEASVSIEINQ